MQVGKAGGQRRARAGANADCAIARFHRSTKPVKLWPFRTHWRSRVCGRRRRRTRDEYARSCERFTRRRGPRTWDLRLWRGVGDGRGLCPRVCTSARSHRSTRTCTRGSDTYSSPEPHICQTQSQSTADELDEIDIELVHSDLQIAQSLLGLLGTACVSLHSTIVHCCARTSASHVPLESHLDGCTAADAGTCHH